MQKTHDLNDMAAFANVVQAGGFTAAANNLGLPKSNVSRRISRLENKLGVRLLERTTRRLHLTDVGEVYFQHCQRILEEANSAGLSVNQINEAPSGLLRIGSASTIGQQLLAPAMTEFLQENPEIQLQLTLTNRSIDLFEDGFDIAIQTLQREDPRLTSRTLGTSAMQLYASTDYIKQKGNPAHPRELNQHEVLVVSEHGSTGKLQLRSNEEKTTLAINPRALINDFNSIYQLVNNGLGIGVMPGGQYKNEESSLVRVLPDWSAPEMEFYMFYPSIRGATPKLKAFVEFIAKKAKE
ncbi:LysR family transcriptional regulator [Pseudomonadota bacterium]